MSIKMWENMTINVWEIMTTAVTSIEERIMTVIDMVDVIIGLMAMPHRRWSMHRLHRQVSGFSSHPSLFLFLIAKRMSAFDRAPGVQTHPPASITWSAGGCLSGFTIFLTIFTTKENAIMKKYSYWCYWILKEYVQVTIPQIRGSLWDSFVRETWGWEAE